MADTAVEIRKKEQAKSAWQMLEKMKPSIAAVLPKHLTPERMSMIAFTAMRKTPKLLECSPESVAGSIMTAAMLGLEPSGPIGHGALIPYWNSRRPGGAGYECQFQPMYQGLLDLARRSGFVKDVQLRAVYKGDRYAYRFGLDPSIEHVPMEGDGADDPNREPTHVYAIVRLTSGGVQWDQMSYAQGIAHGKRYSPSWDGKAFKQGSVWADNPLAMCLKTVLKIVLKLCPKSPEMAAVLHLDDMAEMGKTSTMRKMGDDVFDVDFGDEPAEEQRGGSALDSLVEKEKAKKATPEDSGSAVKATEGATPAVAPSVVAAEAPRPDVCTQSDIDQLEILATEHGIGQKKWKKFIEEELKTTWELLPKNSLSVVQQWIVAHGKKAE